MSKAESELDEALEILDFLQFHIQSAGEAADSKTAIEVVPHSKSKKRYARKRLTVEGKIVFEGCGPEGSERHLAALATVQRRRLLEKIQAVTQQLEDLQRSDDWQAVPPVELEEETEQGIDEKLDAWEEEDAEGYELYEEEMASIRKAVTAKARELPESTFISFAFLGKKGATMFNRTVHAVPGKPSRYPFNFWSTPALCGVKPHFLKSWGWIGDCSLLHLSCKRCEKKLKTLPHVVRLPDFMGGGLCQGLQAFQNTRDDW